MDKFKQIDWVAWIATLGLIIVFRESAVFLMTKWGHPEFGNIAGLISLLIVLFVWRYFKKIPLRLTDTNNKIMKESSFAFLPVCAGSLMMLVNMGADIPIFLFILFASTLPPLWIYAKLAKRWL